MQLHPPPDRKIQRCNRILYIVMNIPAETEFHTDLRLIDSADDFFYHQRRRFFDIELRAPPFFRLLLNPYFIRRSCGECMAERNSSTDMRLGMHSKIT